MKANMHEAKSQLLQLADRAAKGKRVVIAKAGVPYVELIPCRAERRPDFGWLKDQITQSTPPTFNSVSIDTRLSIKTRVISALDAFPLFSQMTFGGEPCTKLKS